MKTITLYGCAIKRHDESFTVIGPLEKDRKRIAESCKLLQPDSGRRVYHVATIEIELEDEKG